MFQSKHVIAAIAAAGVAAAPAFAQTQPDQNQTGPAQGQTSGPAAGSPATMNGGDTNTAVTGSPHQKDVLRDKGNPEGQPGSNGTSGTSGTSNGSGDSGNPHARR